jgi:hypothetical protein
MSCVPCVQFLKWMDIREVVSVSRPTVTPLDAIWYEFGLNVLRNCSVPPNPWPVLADWYSPAVPCQLRISSTRVFSLVGLSSFPDRVICSVVCDLCAHGKNRRFLHREIHICWVQGCNGQLNSVQILASYLYKINVNIIIPSAPMYLNWSLLFRCSD